MRTQGYQPRGVPLRERETFSTGEVSAITNVSQNKIIREFDAGRLPGYRVPMSKFRRITRLGLLLFMSAHGIPETFLTEHKKDGE